MTSCVMLQTHSMNCCKATRGCHSKTFFKEKKLEHAQSGDINAKVTIRKNGQQVYTDTTYTPPQVRRCYQSSFGSQNLLPPIRA